MTREHFNAELKRLQDETCVLGTMVATSITEAVRQLCARDRAGSERLIAWDRRVNEKCHAIEMATLTLIATQAPVATDMRVLAAVLETASELERIGDYAKGIAAISLKLGDAPYAQPVWDLLTEMSVRARDMLDRALDAFARRDLPAAHAIIRQDDGIDDLFNQIFGIAMHPNGALPGVAAGDLTATLERANYLMWIAHNLERSADRVTNICQRVIFTVTGELDDLDPM